MQKRLNDLIETRLGYLREMGDAVVQDEAEEESGKDGLPAKIYENHMAFFAWKFFMKSSVNLANGFAPVAILLWGGWLVIEGQTTVGVIVAFLSGTEKISGPIRNLLGFYRIVAQAQVQHEMIARWM
jgi:ABC-type multidrug transport system fused ATPase/permease subunit